MTSLHVFVIELLKMKNDDARFLLALFVDMISISWSEEQSHEMGLR